MGSDPVARPPPSRAGMLCIAVARRSACHPRPATVIRVACRPQPVGREGRILGKRAATTGPPRPTAPEHRDVAPTRIGGMSGLSRDVSCDDEPNFPSRRAHEPTVAGGVADRSDLRKPRFELAAAGQGARFSRDIHRCRADQLRSDASTRLEERQALDDFRAALPAGEGRRTVSEANLGIRRSCCEQHRHVAYQHGLTSQVGHKRSIAQGGFRNIRGSVNVRNAMDIDLAVYRGVAQGTAACRCAVRAIAA